MRIFKVFFICLLFAGFSYSQTTLAQEVLRFKARIGFEAAGERILAQKSLEGDQKVLLVRGERRFKSGTCRMPNWLEERPHKIQNTDDIGISRQLSAPTRAGQSSSILSPFGFSARRKKSRLQFMDLQTGKLITILERPTESIREAIWSAKRRKKTRHHLQRNILNRKANRALFLGRRNFGAAQRGLCSKAIWITHT